MQYENAGLEETILGEQKIDKSLSEIKWNIRKMFQTTKSI